MKFKSVLLNFKNNKMISEEELYDLSLSNCSWSSVNNLEILDTFGNSIANHFIAKQRDRKEKYLLVAKEVESSIFVIEKKTKGKVIDSISSRYAVPLDLILKANGIPKEYDYKTKIYEKGSEIVVPIGLAKCGLYLPRFIYNKYGSAETMHIKTSSILCDGNNITPQTIISRKLSSKYLDGGCHHFLYVGNYFICPSLGDYPHLASPEDLRPDLVEGLYKVIDTILQSTTWRIKYDIPAVLNTRKASEAVDKNINVEPDVKESMIDYLENKHDILQTGYEILRDLINLLFIGKKIPPVQVPKIRLTQYIRYEAVNTTLRDIIHCFPDSRSLIEIVYLQIVLSIYYYQKFFSLQHNNLTDENIFIKHVTPSSRLSRYNYYSYTANKTSFLIPNIPFIVKIGNFDEAVMYKASNTQAVGSLKAINSEIVIPNTDISKPGFYNKSYDLLTITKIFYDRFNGITPLFTEILYSLFHQWRYYFSKSYIFSSDTIEYKYEVVGKAVKEYFHGNFIDTEFLSYNVKSEYFNPKLILQEDFLKKYKNVPDEIQKNETIVLGFDQ